MTGIKAIVELKSRSPYSQSKVFDSPKKPKEKDDAYDERCWRERMHTTEDGFVFIPPMGFKTMIFEAARRLNVKIPGKQNQTYTKSFEAGILVVDPLVLPVRALDVKPEKLFVPSNGVKGAGKRVMKRFPRIDKWAGEVTFHILDATITKDVFVEVLNHAGLLTGIGRFRPDRGGFYGRFKLESIQWIEDEA